MTVIIPGLVPDLKRTLDLQNRATTPTAANNTPSAARAGDSIATVRTDVLDVAAATEQTKTQNAAAAISLLTEADFDLLEQSTRSPQETVQAQAQASVAAQTKRLPPSMLELLTE